MDNVVFEAINKCCPQDGLTILFENGESVSISNDFKCDDLYLEQFNSKIPSDLEKTTSFFRCGSCMTQDQTICDGIRPIVPLLEKISHRNSYDPVTAIYKDGDEGHVLNTTLQHALEGIALMIVTKYCTLTECYSNYYEGIRPLMSTHEVAEKLAMNVLNDCQSNMVRGHLRVKQLDTVLELTAISRNMRLREILKGDAFYNANANMALPTKFIDPIFFDKKVDEDEDKGIWCSYYNLGIPLIDDQHKQLIELLFELGKEVDDLENDILLEKLLTIYSSVLTHFEEEYKLAQTYDIPFPDEHFDAHQVFLKQLESIFNGDFYFDFQKTLELLRLWAYEHVLVQDCDLVQRIMASEKYKETLG